MQSTDRPDNTKLKVQTKKWVISVAAYCRERSSVTLKEMGSKVCMEFVIHGTKTKLGKIQPCSYW